MFKPVAIVAASLAATVAPLSACTSNESANQPATSSPTAAPSGESMTTQLKTADGTPVANATIDFANGYATVTVETVANHILTPGFHGLHIHSAGRCDANSVAPTGGPSGDFNSAGGHFQVSGHTNHPASGDLTSLEVRSDGGAKLVTTTDAFTAADLRNSSGTALIIHAGPDNFGNIPSRYGATGADEETLATGDSGKRVACGVIAAASATTTSPTSTTAPTTTQVAPATTGETGTVTTTTVVPAPSPSVTSTSTSTVTVTVPTITTTPMAPFMPGQPGNPMPPGGG